MLQKLAMLTAMLVCLAAGLLLLRQQRLELANRNARLFWEIQDTRRGIWSAEARGAALLRPEQLQQRIERARLKLEPIRPGEEDEREPLDPRRGLVRVNEPEALP